MPTCSPLWARTGRRAARRAAAPGRPVGPRWTASGCCVETRLPGRVSQAPAADTGGPDGDHRPAPRHRGLGPGRAGAARAWVDQPLAALRRLPAWLAPPAASRPCAPSCTGALAERAVLASSTHGDFWPGNVLVADGPVVTGHRRLGGRPAGRPARRRPRALVAGRPAGLARGRRRPDAGRPGRVEADLAAAGSPGRTRT